MLFKVYSKKHSIEDFYLENITKKGCSFNFEERKITANCYIQKREVYNTSFRFQEIQFHKTEFNNNRLMPSRTWFCIMGKNGGNP